MIIPSHTASTVYFQFWFFISWAVLYFSWQVYVPDIKQTPIHVVIERLFTAHQLILMCQVDLMDGLPLLHQRHQDCIKSDKFSFCCKNPASGFRYLFRCLSLGFQCIVHGFGQRTLFHFTASVAYIWWFKTVGTYFLFKVFTVAVAYEFTLFADGYQRMPAVICTTYFFPPACFSVLAGIVRVTSITGVLFDGIVADFLCNGSPVSSKFLSEFCKSHVLLQSAFYVQPVLII